MSMKLYFVETGKLRANPDNMFPTLPPDEYNDLKASIAMHGIQDPLIVVPEENDVYTIQAGHNRWKAAKELSLPTVPCVESSAEMFEAIVETEIYRRMLSKEERDRIKTLKGPKQAEVLEKYLNKHLLPEIMKIYISKKISPKMALSYAKLPEDQQQEHWDLLDQNVIEIIAPEDPEEEKKRLKERAEQTALVEKIQADLKVQTDQLSVKEKEIKQFKINQEKAREYLAEKEEEFEKVKKDAYDQAGETLRAAVKEEIEEAKKQVETYKKAVIEKDHEIDDLKGNAETAKRQLRDAEGKTNEVKIAMQIYKADVTENVKRLFSPEAMNDHLAAATHSVEAVDRLLNSGCDWNPAIRDKAKQNLEGLQTRIGNLLQDLPNRAALPMPVLPMLGEK